MNPRLLRPRASVLPLDAKAPTAAYSLRRVRSAYSGAAVKVRRSSDNAEQDFTPAEISSGQLANWIGSGNDGFVTTWYDQSGNGLNVTQSTAANQPKVSLNTGKFGTSSVLFDGSNDFLAAGGQSNFAFGTGNFTIELWIRMTTVSAVNVMLDFRVNGDAPNPGASRIDMALVNGNLVWYVLNGIRIQGATAVTTGSWFHVAACRSGTSTRMFLNGVQQGTTWTDTTNYTVGASRPVFGRNGESLAGSEWFAGYMDEVRITKGRADYTANFTPPVR